MANGNLLVRSGKEMDQPLWGGWGAEMFLVVIFSGMKCELIYSLLKVEILIYGYIGVYADKRVISCHILFTKNS